MRAPAVHFLPGIPQSYNCLLHHLCGREIESVAFPSRPQAPTFSSKTHYLAVFSISMIHDQVSVLS